MVLEGNVEDRAKKPKGSSQKKEKAAAAVSKAQALQSDVGKTQEVMATIGEPVTISGDWTGSGTIALVSGLTVIQTEVPSGTLQPLVTSDGTSVISLDASAIGMPVPFSIPISVAHSLASGSVPISVAGHVSEAILESSTNAETSEAENVLASTAIEECVTVQAVTVEETDCAETQQENDQNTHTADDSNNMEISVGDTAE